MFFSAGGFIMKFIDEAIISVGAGKGGDGCMSFRRENFIPFGGPNGGDGGDGGSVYLKVDPNLNTLIDFRSKNIFTPKMSKGMGTDSTGKQGEDLIIRVPAGTMVYDSDSDRAIGDLVEPDAVMLVCPGWIAWFGQCAF